MLDADVQQISHFLLVGIARGLKDIRRVTRADIATAGTSALSGTKESHAPTSNLRQRRDDTNATASIATTATPGIEAKKTWAQVLRDPPPVVDIHPSASVAFNPATAPEYYNLWAQFYSQDKFTGPYNPAALALLEAEHGEITTADIDGAIRGDDGTDPITFWNSASAPKAMQEIAQQHDKRIVEEKIRDWKVEAEFTKRKGKGKRGAAVRMPVEVEALDVEEISVGEEACKDV